MATYTPEQIAATQALLAKGDKLGQAASAQTGVQYNPQYTTYQPAPIAAAPTQQSTQPVYVPPYQEPAIPTLQQIMQEGSAPSSEVTSAQNEQGNIVKSIEAIIGKQSQEGARKAELEAQAGIPNLQRNLNEINSQIMGINASAFNATMGAENRLAPTFAIFGEQAQIERQKSAQTFGLAAAASAMQGNIALAQDNIQRALDAEFSGLETQLKYYDTLLNLNRDKLSKAEAKQAQMLELRVAERNRLLAEQKENKANINQVMVKAAEMGASPLILRNILSARTPEEALQLAASAGVLVQNTFKTQTDANGNLVEFELSPNGKIISSRVLDYKAGSSGAGSPGSTAVAPYGSDDYWKQLFSGSKGAKALTGEQTAPLTKAAIVINQVGELAAQIRSTDTDPILGILRDNNPYDVKARLIQAQLRATVPNLARGVYGEVGVLTDTDIANYIQTLPNIRGTEEANNLILGMTLRTIQNSFRSYLESYANSGRDVSGFVNQYNAISAEVQRLTQPATSPNWNAYNPNETSDVSFSSQPSQEGTGIINSVTNYAKWLFGF